MALTTDVSPIDAGKLIADGIKAQIRNTIYNELMTYIEPQIKIIATNTAEDVTRKSLIQIDKDWTADRVSVHVMFREEPK